MLRCSRAPIDLGPEPIFQGCAARLPLLVESARAGERRPSEPGYTPAALGWDHVNRGPPYGSQRSIEQHHLRLAKFSVADPFRRVSSLWARTANAQASASPRSAEDLGQHPLEEDFEESTTHQPIAGP